MTRPRWFFRLFTTCLTLAAPLAAPARAASLIDLSNQFHAGGPVAHHPCLSPDGDVLGFFTDQGILRLELPQTANYIGGMPAWGVTGLSIRGDVILITGLTAENRPWPRRWTAASGWVDLQLPLPPNANVWGHALSLDGLVVGGATTPENGEGIIFTWDATGGFTAMPMPPGHDAAVFGGMNATGTVIVGTTGIEGGEEGKGFIWADGSVQSFDEFDPKATGKWIVAGVGPNSQLMIHDRFTGIFRDDAMTGAGAWPAGTGFDPVFVSWSGDIVFGHTILATGYPAEDFVWREGQGLMTAPAYLQSLGANLAGWTSLRIQHASAGARMLVGRGNHSGSQAYWYFAADGDDDGILDEWESAGSGYMLSDGSRVSLAVEEGCSPVRKDVFVEIDAMSGHAPVSLESGSPMDQVVQAFASAPVMTSDGSFPRGVNLHVVLSEHDLPAVAFDASSIWSEFDTIKAAFFGGPNTLEERNAVYADELKELWRKIAHYCLFANSIIQPPSKATEAEFVGNDAIVMVGYSTVTPARKAKYQAGAFMHALGKNFGLESGGHQGATGPNYFSVMNPLFTFPYFSIQDEQKGFWEPRFSDEEMAYLNTYGLDESVGILSPTGRNAGKPFPYAIPLGATSSTGSGAPCSDRTNGIEDCMDWGFYGRMVDWNANHEIDEDPVDVPINVILPPHRQFPGMLGRNDWTQLQYNFRLSSNFADGPQSGRGSSRSSGRLGATVLEGGEAPLTFDNQEYLDRMPEPPICPDVTHPSPPGLICSNESITLNAGVSGTYLRYQWFEIPDPWHEYPWTPIAGATDSVLTLASMSPDVYWRRCIVSNACDSDTLVWYVTVNSGPPQIVQQPQNLAVHVGEEISLYALVNEGYFPVWRKNGAVVGEPGSDLYIATAAKSDAGVYRASIINGCDSVLTDVVNVVVLDPLGVESESAPEAFSLRPRNPSRGRLTVSFSLPTAEPATLAVFDVVGRRLASRDVNGGAAGTHTMALGEHHLPAGYYFIRLRQGGRSLSKPVLVLR